MFKLKVGIIKKVIYTYTYISDFPTWESEKKKNKKVKFPRWELTNSPSSPAGSPSWFGEGWNRCSSSCSSPGHKKNIRSEPNSAKKDLKKESSEDLMSFWWEDTTPDKLLRCYFFSNKNHPKQHLEGHPPHVKEHSRRRHLAAKTSAIPSNFASFHSQPNQWASPQIKTTSLRWTES